jgi:CP12 domain.
MNDINEVIEKEVVEARTVCDVTGSNSKECAAAWDAVEELQAEASHQKQKNPKTLLNSIATITLVRMNVVFMKTNQFFSKLSSFC